MRASVIGRWAVTARSFGVMLVLSALAATVGLMAHGCDEHLQPFQCGVPLEGNQSVTRSCDGPNEVCICWKHYCARKQTPDHVKGDANYCPSGFRYRREPFGPDDAGSTSTGTTTDSTTTAIAIDKDLGDCVPPELVEWVVVGTQLCADSEHAPDIFKDSGASTETPDGDGSTSGDDASASATTSTSMTTGGTGGTGTGGTGGAL